MHRHYRHWTPAEDAELIASAGTKRLATTATNLGRTIDAARRRALALGINHQQEARRTAGMSISDVAVALGTVDERVSSWIRRGWLKTHTGYSVWARFATIDAYDVSLFLSERGALLTYIKPADLAWREEVDQARAALLSRYIDRATLCTLLLWSRGTLAFVRQQHGFDSVPILSIGKRSPYYYERAAVRAWLEAHPRYRTSMAKEQL